MSLTVFCRCECAEKKEGPAQFQSVQEVVPVLHSDDQLQEEAEDVFWATPAKARKFSTTITAPLAGVPLAEGELYHILSEERIDTVKFSLYINGFSFSSPNNEEVSVLLSPFCLVRCCKFQSGSLAGFLAFKVHHFVKDTCLYFALPISDSEAAERERSRWVLSLSYAIHIVTRSLFPCFSLVSKPVKGTERTSMRLLAGYLLHSEDYSTVSVIYCELQAPQGSSGILVAYEDERCLKTVRTFAINQNTMHVEVLGINCCCFSISGHHFSTRTNSERKIWLRAISNVKVKLETGAPDPGPEQLVHYRISVDEQLSQLEATFERDLAPQALLPPLSVPFANHVDFSIDDAMVQQVIQDVENEVRNTLGESFQDEAVKSELREKVGIVRRDCGDYATDLRNEESEGNIEFQMGGSNISTATKEKRVGRTMLSSTTSQQSIQISL
eukprot:gnl/MRDRNA2_/MRDRNA2_127904_c0_seq1.p1 gnl/MRDRNA2_/MRDRNA2_127904_c0~~gnl/MRDRNA2_/MRDRNA2_127904_c0_seq1.p1  ORF type:complete len:442 (+),score=63.84 gnl/MRDRNA2_/MRDRNA2_127904_c0_seq1:127-1452(+)